MLIILTTILYYAFCLRQTKNKIQLVVLGCILFTDEFYVVNK